MPRWLSSCHYAASGLAGLLSVILRRTFFSRHLRAIHGGSWALLGLFFRSVWGLWEVWAPISKNGFSEMGHFSLVWAPLWEPTKHESLKMQKSNEAPNGATENACCLTHVYARMCFSPHGKPRGQNARLRTSGPPCTAQIDGDPRPKPWTQHRLHSTQRMTWQRLGNVIPVDPKVLLFIKLSSIFIISLSYFGQGSYDLDGIDKRLFQIPCCSKNRLSPAHLESALSFRLTPQLCRRTNFPLRSRIGIRTDQTSCSSFCASTFDELDTTPNIVSLRSETRRACFKRVRNPC